jgi:hypothetical protein
MVDRVIDLLDRDAPVTGGGGGDGPVVVPGEIPLPEGLHLSHGEVVQISYADGVVVHEAISVACTQSTLATNPVRSGNSATAHHEYSV